MSALAARNIISSATASALSRVLVVLFKTLWMEWMSLAIFTISFDCLFRDVMMSRIRYV